MREFIQFCSSIFVIIGMLIVAGSGLLLAAAITQGETTAGIATLAAGLIGGAAATMGGGSAYMLCEISDQLKHMKTPTHTNPTTNTEEIENLPSPGSITPAGTYRRPDGSLFEHPGGPVLKYGDTVL
jgi:hypothetical protein